MRAAVFNRSDFEHPADGWYQIEPKGNHPSAAAECIQVIDDQAVTSIVDQFNAAAAAGRLSHGTEMLIDHEHFKDVLTEESIAYGWLTALQAREDGIYGQIRWTATGQAAVDGGDYRFFSTEYEPEDLERVSDGNPHRVRPLRLAGLTLTNSPNNKGGRPITNRAGVPAILAPANPAAAARLVARMAAREHRASGGSLSQAYLHVMNREPQIAGAALGKGTKVREKRWEAMGDTAEFAAGLLADLAAKDGGPGDLAATYRRICNRHPRLVRMANREVALENLTGMETAAQAAFREGDSRQEAQALTDLTERLRIQSPGAGPGDIWEKAKDLYPRVFWAYVLTFKFAP